MAFFQNVKTMADQEKKKRQQQNAANYQLVDRLLNTAGKTLSSQSKKTAEEEEEKKYPVSSKVTKSKTAPKPASSIKSPTSGRKYTYAHGEYIDSLLQGDAKSKRKADVTEEDILKDPAKRDRYKFFQAQLSPAKWKNARGSAEDFWANKQFGAYDTDKPWMMSREQVSKAIPAVSQKITEAEEKKIAYDNRTPEEIQAKKQEITDAMEAEGRLAILANYGIPLMQIRGMDGRTKTWVAETADERNGPTTYIKERPEDYWEGNNRNDYDPYIYDAVYGNGAYERRFAELYETGTDEEFEAFDQELDDLWDRLENGSITWDYLQAKDKFSRLNRQDAEEARAARNGFGIKDYQKSLMTLEKEQQVQNDIGQLEQNAPEGTGEYIPQYGTGAYEGTDLNLLYTSEADKAYWFANSIDPGSEDLTDPERYEQLDPASFMTDDQRNVFNRYYNAGDKNSAMAYYNALLPYLKQLKTDYKDKLETEMSQNEYAALMALQRIASAPIAGVMGTIGSGLALLGNEDAQDPTGPWYSLTRTNRNIQSARSEAWGNQLQEWFPNWKGAKEAGQFLNGVAYSIADMLVATGLSGGSAAFAQGGTAEKVAEGVIQFIMSGEATAGTMLEQLEAGKDPTEAALFALGSGAIEAITEKYSIEALLKPDIKEMLGKPWKLAKYLLKNTSAEGSEEAASDVLGYALDVILSAAYGHENEIMAEYNRILAENPGMTEGEATRQVLMKYAGEVGRDALAGSLSGLLMSGARSAETRVKNTNINKEVGTKAVRNGIEAVMDAEPAGRTGAGTETESQETAATEENAQTAEEQRRKEASAEAVNEFKIVEAAEKMGENTESAKKAKAIREKYKKGKTVSMAEYGDLIRTIVAESSEEIGNIAKTVLGDSFQKQLKDAGETENIEGTADALVDMVVNGNMDKANMVLLAASKTAQQILSSYKTKEAFDSLMQKTQGIREASKSVMEMITDPEESGITEEKADEIMAGAEVANNNDKLIAQGKSSGSENEIIADGKYGDITGFEVKRVTDADGNTSQRVLIKTADGRSTDIANVKAINEPTAKVLKLLESDQGKTIGSNMASALMQTAGKAKSIGATVSDAMKILWSEELGLARPKTNLSTENETQIRDAVRADMDAADAARAENRREIKPGQGKVTYNGTAYGSNAFNEALKGMGRAIRTEAQAVASIAKSAGFDVELYYDENDTANQGSYSGANGIRINLAGTYNTEGAHRSALATFAHEVTHNLEANSMGAYKALRTFVLNSIRKSGMDLQNELQGIMDTYALHGQEIDLHGAIAEMVAKGCEQVLTSENVVRQMKEQDPGLYGKVKGAVQRLVDRIRSLIGDTRATSSRYAQAISGVANQMEKVWMAAYTEALDAEGTVTDTNGKEYSFMGTDAGTGASVYMSNYPENTSKQIKQEDLIKNIQNVFSKNPILLTIEGYDGRGTRNILAEFDPAFDPENKMKTDAGKLAYNKKVTSNPENRVRLNLAGDMQQILTESVNYDSRSDKRNDPDVIQWHYFNDNIYYVAQGSDIMEPYRMDIAVKEKKDGSFVYTFEALKDKNRKEKKLSFMEKFTSVNAGRTGESASAFEGRRSEPSANDNGKEGNGRPSDINSIDDLMDSVNSDREYAEAVENGDIEKATQMLMDKLRRTEGVIPFMAPHWDAGKAGETARLIKDKVPEAIAEAAADMSKLVPENAVLIPMPDHTGKVTESTDTMVLAKAIGELTGRPVVVALEGAGHESRHEAKSRDEKGASQEELGFRRIAELPEGTFPIFVDNIVGSGITADAARMAMGGGMTLALTKTVRSKGIKGLKNAIVTYDTNKRLIPLSQRFNVSKKDTRYSIQEDYSKAVDRGDMEGAREAVVKYGESKGYTIHAFHGTGRADRVGNVFLPERATSGPMAFFTDNRQIAENYARDKKDTSIEYDEEYGDYFNQFRVKLKNGKNVPVGKLWSTLPYSERRRITEAAKHITLDDEAEEIIWDDNAKYGVGDFTEYELRAHGGNAIETLIEGWLNGGTLWQREGDFLKVLEMAGIKNVIWNNPDYREEKVYDTLLKIQNPFDTSTMYTEEFIDGLEAWWSKQDQSKYQKVSNGADFWDKNNTNVEEFAETARREIPEGNTHNWTRIPDAVTDYLKSLGYDGIKDQGGKGGGMGHTVWIPFSSEQIKSAEPVTYDDQGNIIQLKDRFNENKKDIRYSFMDEMDFDTRTWMENVPEWSMQTEAEKVLLRNFKDLRMKGQLDRERIRKVDAEIARLEKMQADGETREPSAGATTGTVTVNDALKRYGLSMDGDRIKSNGTTVGTIKFGVLNIYAPYRDLLNKLKNSGAFEYDEKLHAWTAKQQNIHADNDRDIARRLENLRFKKKNLQKAMDETNEKLAKITSDEGFGGMMHRQQKIVQDLLYNKTQAEVRDSVEKMEQAAHAIRARIEENKEAVGKIEQSGVMDRINQILGQTTADKAAGDLKKQFRSSWTKKQILEYLNPILLKMSAGEAFEEDVRMLAEVLVNSNSENMALDEDLAALRGATITISKGQLAELRGTGSSLKEIRARLAGTGIRVKVGERSSLTDDIEDMISEYGAGVLGELGGEKDALENFVSRVEERRNDAVKGNNYEERLADAYAAVMGVSAAVADDLYLPADNRAREQILELAEYVKSLRAETREQQKALTDIANQMEAMQKAGAQASNKSALLMRDVNVAIDYYSRISKIAVDEAKQKRTSATIEMLKSEHAQKILKNNEEWRNLIERDKKARDQAETNMKARGKIDTALKRMFNLLKNPKGLNNIPEYMQGLAREVLTTFTDNDLGGGLKLTRGARDQLAEAKRLLTEWERQSGKFNLADLNAGEEVVILNITNDLQTIYDGIAAWNQDIKGKNKLDTLQQRGQILSQMAEAVGEIYTAIKAEQEIQIGNRRVAVEDAAYKVAKEAEKSHFKGERTGVTRGIRNFLHKAIISGTMTPEYFFRTIGNEGMTDLWEEYHWAENRNGLELYKAQQRLKEIADQHGYRNWDPKQTMTLQLESGEVKLTLGQLMSLWATWKREKTLGPEMSEHLTKGGFYVEQNLDSGFAGREKIQKKAYRVTEADMENVKSMLTEEQRKYVDDVVLFMSRDMSDLGNAASMAAYGIRLYKEKYYFPFQMWDGVKSRKSNDAGQGASGNQAFHPSFSKTRTHGANNAVIIGDFTQIAADHIVGMINYATMGLANENLNKVLNQQTSEDPYGTKRNVRAIFEEAYGKEALDYLMKLKVQLEGGAYTVDKSVYDKLISAFRKNAVAGSMSVAMQQPISYLRAAMVINPKYLTAALNPAYYRGSYKEMMAHSGVAVIKEMGRFDMNAGQSAREYLTPEGKEGKARKAWDFVTDKLTILPEVMDRITWTRMWSACKVEQKALHPEMNVNSEEFLDLVGERFNELMRRTQVYDSVLVKSANMRNQNPAMKTITSFMAEPTLTANVLADAVRQAIHHEKGGLKTAMKAGGIYFMGAILQAAVKAGWGTGRTPDDKKNGVENFLYRFWSNLIGEADPLTLIPGYSTIIDALKGSDISDNAWGMLTKIVTASQTGIDALLGNKSRGWYRDIEDSAAQLAQIFTGLPGKNLMRDGRAMYNWITGGIQSESPYAWRDTSGSVIRNQAKDLFFDADNLIGVANKYLGEAGYDTSTTGYYRRVYQAVKAGDEERQQDLIDYLLHGKGVKKEESVWSKIKGLIQNDYRDEAISRKEAEDMMKKADPKLKDKDLLKTLDKVDYLKAGGEDENYTNYTPLYEAMEADDDSAVEARKKYLTENGYKEKDVISAMKSHVKEMYKEDKIGRKEAEALYAKYDPKMTQKDIAKALDEIEYEERTGRDVESYSNYTPLYDAIDEGNTQEAAKEIERLKQLEYKAEAIDSAISGHIIAQYKAGDLTRQQAESKMKAFCKNMKADDIWWTFDRVDFEKETGKDPGGQTYYRLYDAIEQNRSAVISSAVKTMVAHGIKKENIKSQLQKKYKSEYLAAKGNEKVRLKNALIMAYKAIGISETEANKIINKWK